MNDHNIDVSIKLQFQEIRRHNELQWIIHTFHTIKTQIPNVINICIFLIKHAALIKL